MRQRKSLTKRLSAHDRNQITIAKRRPTRGTQDGAFQVSTNIAEMNRSLGLLLLFEGPLLNRVVDGPQVIDANVGLSAGTAPDEVGDRDRRQQTEQQHNDHDFYDRKTGLEICSLFHSALKTLILLQFRYQAFLSGSVIEL